MGQVIEKKEEEKINGAFVVIVTDNGIRVDGNPDGIKVEKVMSMEEIVSVAERFVENIKMQAQAKMTANAVVQRIAQLQQLQGKVIRPPMGLV
jgi:hypothetical protein